MGGGWGAGFKSYVDDGNTGRGPLACRNATSYLATSRTRESQCELERIEIDGSSSREFVFIELLIFMYF